MKKIATLSCAFVLLSLAGGANALSFGYGGKGHYHSDELTRAETQEQASRHFNRLDKNGDEKIDLAELQGRNEDKRIKYNLMLRQVDGNGDEVVTSAEFINHALAQFDTMDSDKDGILTPEERQAGKQAYREEFMRLHFDEADTNGDGALSWEEFANMRNSFSHNPRGIRNGRWRHHHE